MAKKYSNVYVADWERAVKKYNYKLTSDKIHISGETTKKYVKLIAKEIKKINSKMTGIFTAYNNISVDSFSPFKLPISTLGDSEVMNKLKYKSSNEKVATISNRGVVSPKNKGKTVITVALSNQEFIKIKINIIPKNTAKKNYSKKGVCYIADAKIYPRIHLKIKNRKTIYSVPKFEIEDKTIATVDEAGIIYAKKKGKTRIKCSLEDYTAYINLEIKRKRKNK
jgi:alpha-L-fucosidase 2